MKFPYPENPSDWQTAYTRDDAHHDSGKHVSGSGGIFSILALCYAAFTAVLTLNAYKIGAGLAPLILLALKIGISLIPVVFLLFLFSKVRSIASNFAVDFMNDFYHPTEGVDLKRIIINRLYGKPKLPPPLNMWVKFDYIMIREGEIQKANSWPGWSAQKLGGPLLLIVFDGCALYLERGNRFSRVVGPGDKAPFLEWYETIKYVVDLRPKVKDGEFDAWTKDGINIKLKVQIECRVGDPKNQDPNYANLVYPYDPVAVRKAVERYSVRWSKRLEGEPEDFTWVDAAWGQVTGIVPNYIGSRMLDDLFIADRNKGQILSPNAVQEIFGKLNGATQGFGVYITDFQVMEVKLPKEILAAQNDQWKAEKQRIATRIDGEAKAFNIRAREKAKAEAQHDIIIAIAEGLEKNKNEKFTEPLLLSLSGVLDESLREPLTRAYLARETLETLEKIKEMLK
jgi:regulator of protease activity HflC (stomatin/prohibitin superfamily)